MRSAICKAIGVIMLTMMCLACLSCSDAKCLAERTKCKLDCPSTMGLKEACEQKCNFLYDVCRRKS
ncbi:MAG: hypothetical protein PHG54_08560 [Smithellaceae bacterium]|nr:hypothetical protein [Syntrophaceae bacterium]MDD4241469.1 hypothetical protein [Smithellaceae bacterium]NLX52731.1 hypothetical protein [Deltaproteobacteria bacterium]